MLLTKKEIEDMVHARFQETNGATGQISVRWKPSSLPSLFEIEAANLHAWNMFPSGGWEWFVARNDYYEKELGYEREA
jgi:hypothetical protein